MEEKKYSHCAKCERIDVAIIGGGIAGLSAAMYCGRFNLKTIVLDDKPGGAVMLTDKLENFPSYDSITGMELVDKLVAHAKKFGAEMIMEKAVSVKKAAEGCFRISTNKKDYHAKSVIFAAGTKWKKLGIPGEEEYNGKGVHFCALCDGAFYKNKTIAIVGGSDTAAKEANLLTTFGKKVYIIYRRDKIRAEPITVKRVEENEKIEIITNTNVLEVIGDKFMNKVVLDKEFNGSKELELDALFIAIGHIPLTDLAKDAGVKLDDKGFIIVDKDGKTNISGFFAAGDVTDSTFKQAITSAGMGVSASFSAHEHIEKENPCKSI